MSEEALEPSGVEALDSRQQRMRELMTEWLSLIGEAPAREGLTNTPLRVQQAWDFLTSGYRQDPKQLLNNALFTAPSDEMVVVKDIDFYSLCEHHLLPFFGKCHVAYIPKGKIVGISKIPRIVEMFARRLQVQEKLTTQIAEIIRECIRPVGVGVVMEAQHLCMMMRGVQKQNTIMTTSSMLGCFRTDEKSRAEFLGFIRPRS